MKLLFILIIMINPLLKSQNIEKKIYFGGGCFWCIEAFFENVNGVKSIVSGYAGGNAKDPKYEEVITGKTNHAEVCQISYNPEKNSWSVSIMIQYITLDQLTPDFILQIYTELKCVRIMDTSVNS